MKIFITGATGFIGRALVRELLLQNHKVAVLEYKSKSDFKGVEIYKDFNELENLDEFDALINLAGANIFAKRWNEKYKNKLYQSRILVTSKLVELLKNSNTPPAVVLSASAGGFYGDVRDLADENMPCGSNFTARLCSAWENCALEIENYSRLCILRTTMVLDNSGGALAKMQLAYRLGFGAILGKGEQIWAWLSLCDQIRAIKFLLTNEKATGAFNLANTNLVTQKEFHQFLKKGKIFGNFAQISEPMLKILLGERAELLLANQAIFPYKLLDLGFKFTHTNLADVL